MAPQQIEVLLTCFFAFAVHCTMYLSTSEMTKVSMWRPWQHVLTRLLWSPWRSCMTVLSSLWGARRRTRLSAWTNRRWTTRDLICKMYLGCSRWSWLFAFCRVLQHLYLVGTKTHRLFGYVNVTSAEVETAYLCNRIEQSRSTSDRDESHINGCTVYWGKFGRLSLPCSWLYKTATFELDHDIRWRVCTTSEVS